MLVLVELLFFLGKISFIKFFPILILMILTLLEFGVAAIQAYIYIYVIFLNRINTKCFSRLYNTFTL